MVLWHFTFVYFCIQQVSDTGTVACYFRILLYPAGFRQWYCGMLLSYTSVSSRFQTLVLWHVTFVYFCIQQVSDTGTVACYFRILLYPAGFRDWYCGMLLSYTSVSSRFQTMVLWHVTFVYWGILQFSNTCTVLVYFRTMLYPPDFRHLASGMLLSYTDVSS
jgi:hypothetical protein